MDTLGSEAFRRAAAELNRVARGDALLASRVVGEVLLAQAEQRSAAVSHALIDARMGSHGATSATAEVGGVRPLEVLRHGPRDQRERALVSVLMAQHLEALLAGQGGAHTVRSLLPGLDWLEFTGPYAPYSAAHATLPADTRRQLAELLRGAPVEGASEPAAAAVRVLRGVPGAPTAVPSETATLKGYPLEELDEGGAMGRGKEAGGAMLSLAGEVYGLTRGPLARALGVLTGWSVVRGAARAFARQVFSLRRPMTLSLDGDLLRVVGHTELLGRTLATFDVRYPLAELSEVRRESRYPMLPVAVASVGLALGAFFGAKSVIEGAGAVYFPLVGLGIGLVLGGLVFELLLRALFPGVQGKTRLHLRAEGARSVELGELSIDEVDRLLDALDARFGGRPTAARATEPERASATTEAPATERAEPAAPAKARRPPRASARRAS